MEQKQDPGAFTAPPTPWASTNGNLSPMKRPLVPESPLVASSLSSSLHRGQDNCQDSQPHPTRPNALGLQSFQTRDQPPQIDNKVSGACVWYDL